MALSNLFWLSRGLDQLISRGAFLPQLVCMSLCDLSNIKIYLAVPPLHWTVFYYRTVNQKQYQEKYP